MPGLSGTPITVTLASSRLKAMPETTACSILTSSSKVIRVPDLASSLMSMSQGVKLESTRSRPLEAGDDDDLAAGQVGAHAGVVDALDAVLGERRIGLDRHLPAVVADGL